MPTKARRPCPVARCPGFQPCPTHRRGTHPEQPSAFDRGYGPRWQAYRKEFLAKPENRTCACGCGATHDGSGAGFVVDHIVPPPSPDHPLFWDPTNHQALHENPCHKRKILKYDGGWGNPRRPHAPRGVGEKFPRKEQRTKPLDQVHFPETVVTVGVTETGVG